MNTATSIETGTLRRQDIIEYEPLLKTALRAIIPFSSYSLMFPAKTPEDMEADPVHPFGRAALENDRLSLPLTHSDRLLAIFEARGVNPEETARALPFLPHMASLCLEQIKIRKSAITDPLTGLFNRHCMHQALIREISGIVGAIMPGPEAMADDSLQGHSACFGLIILDLDRFRQINDNFGHNFGDRILVLAAERLRAVCPKQTLVCRLDGDSFGVLWPQASRARMSELAVSLGAELARVTARFTPLREDVGVSASIGYVNYPQDLQGAQFQKAPEEQAWLILEKAEKALSTAKAGGRSQIYSFRQILTQGGVVLDVMPMNRLVINLGRSMDAHEGQRFLIWSRKFNGSETIVGTQGDAIFGHYPPMYKAEISLVEVQDEMSIAEVLVQSDPNWTVEKGDKLTLLDDHAGRMEQREVQPGDRTPQKDPLTGLYPYRDFLQAWQSVRGQAKSFCMVLMRLETPHAERTPMDKMKEEQFFQTLAGRVETLFGPEALGGRFSVNCIIYHVPGLDQEECLRMVRELLEDERFAGLEKSVGIAAFPFLDYTRSDILENARKALDHAEFLHDERIACFDSVSLNISADRLFAQGETYDAIAEYKKALTVDEGNLLARNSLGVCYARLNKYATARTIFQDLIALHPDHIMPLYNFGCACLKDGDPVAARQAFEQVLTIQPDHVYAMIRLGLMAEEEGDFERAWNLYEQVRAMSDGEHLASTHNLAYRYLARLAFRRDDRDTAREYLHQAITANPQDAHSFHLLATIYLERGDDPEIAESLARQSVHLKADVPAFWEVLITALEQQDKTEEANQTKIRAAAQTC
ncbi:MAG: diguanylate cyclase [Desulfomicrobium apsheronum]|nr:diguanylate cyclase [Desulfomicrobium apsheronum]